MNEITDQVLQFGGSVAEATLDIRMQFIRKVYAILYVSFLHSVAPESR